MISFLTPSIRTLTLIFFLTCSHVSFGAFFEIKELQHPLGSSCSIEYSAANSPSGTGGDFTPFPWGSEVVVPLQSLIGVWAPTSVECSTYFLFQRKPSKEDLKIMSIEQYDPETCETVASGVGYEIDRVFRVVMASTKSDKFFNLTVRAFDSKDLNKSKSSAQPDLNPRLNNQQLIVIHLYPNNEWNKRISYPLIRISPETEKICRPSP